MHTVVFCSNLPAGHNEYYEDDTWRPPSSPAKLVEVAGRIEAELGRLKNERR